MKKISIVDLSERMSPSADELDRKDAHLFRMDMGDGEGRRAIMERDISSTTSQSSLRKVDDDWLQRTADHIPCLGIMLSLIASVLIGTAGLLVKEIQSVHGVQVSVFRAMIQTAVYAIILAYRGIKPVPARGEFWPVFLRAFLCSCSITGAYFSLKLIPLEDCTIIKLSLPVWVLIISYFTLGEACSLLKISAVIFSLAGVILTTKPEDCLRLLGMITDAFNISNPIRTNNVTFQNGLMDVEFAEFSNTSDVTMIQVPQYSDLLKGRLLALASSICLAVSIISLRMCKATPVEVIIFWLSQIAIVCGSALLWTIGEWRFPDNWTDVGLILLNSLFGASGQWFLTSSLKVEQSGVISLVRTFDIIVAFFYSSVLLHEVVQTTSIIGAILVSYGTFAMALPKLLDTRRRLRKRTW